MTETTFPIRFGRYELLERIAQGGMAEVFKARLSTSAGAEKYVCIKRILPTLSQNREFISLFVQEAKTTLPLTHGNVTQVFDFGEVEGIYFLAMEYIRGKNLLEILQRAAEVGIPLGVASALFIASEICKGLQYAHSYTDNRGQKQAVIHRDVTPHNVLVSYNGEVKLTDFGIALAASKATPSDDVIRGKPIYLSPEQANGQVGDTRSDIFSLGTVLYEMLTGLRPFEAATTPKILERVKTFEVPSLISVRADFDEQLDAIVQKSLAKSPEVRYQRASEMHVALSSALHRLAPGYTAEQLAQQMHDLFAWEIAQHSGSTETSEDPRDRLLFQLSRAGMAVDKKTKTEELLAMGTVPIGDSVAHQGSAKPRHVSARVNPKAQKSIVWGVVSVVTVGFASLMMLGLYLAFRVPDSTGAGQNVESIRPNPVITEHLTPPSLAPMIDDISELDDDYESVSKQDSALPINDPHRESNTDRSARAPLEKRKEPRVRPRSQDVGYLNLNSWPWSVVYVDGRRLEGNTPIYRVRLSAGRHLVKFINPELGLKQEVEVTVEGATTKTVAVSLQP